MVQISIKTNFPDIQAALERFGKQARFAAAVALTRTAQDVQADLRTEMKAVFDRPTRFTLNSLFLKRATKDNLEARVFLKDDFGTKAHYLMPQIEGGARPMKRFEQLLMQRGLLEQNERAVPGEGARIDSFGNMSKAQLVQILSQLNAFNLAGSSQNATFSKRSKAKRSKVSYFYARQGEVRRGRGAWKGGEKEQHLRTGVYARTALGVITPVLIFVKGTTYKARFNFFPIAAKTIKRVLPGHFARELENAKRTARFGKSGIRP